MFEEPPHYKSYLLTIWEERSEDPNIASYWRFSLEDPHSGKRVAFSSLDALFEALAKVLEDSKKEKE